MKIRNEVTIKAPIGETWAALNDMPRVARCAPGAQLIEERADGSCVGTVAVRLGPVALKFKGVVEFIERDAAAFQAVAKARGAEEKARGSASADVVFSLVAADQTTRIIVDSDILLAGSIAQYGRGAALIQSTAQALMNDFAKNLEADLNGQTTGEASEISGAQIIARGLLGAGAAIFAKKDGA